MNKNMDPQWMTANGGGNQQGGGGGGGGGGGKKGKGGGGGGGDGGDDNKPKDNKPKGPAVPVSAPTRIPLLIPPLPDLDFGNRP